MDGLHCRLAKRWIIGRLRINVFFILSMKLLFVIIFATTLAHAAAADLPITQQELVRRTQELYDVIVPGSRTPWKKYFADDCIFSNEKGHTMDKAKLVADITPMPAGYSGSIKIDNVQSRILGDTAVLSYDAMKPKPSSAKISRPVITSPTPGCGATTNGKSSPARPTVTTKTRPLEKLTRKNSVTSTARTSSRLVK